MSSLSCFVCRLIQNKNLSWESVIPQCPALPPFDTNRPGLPFFLSLILGVSFIRIRVPGLIDSSPGVVGELGVIDRIWRYRHSLTTEHSPACLIKKPHRFPCDATTGASTLRYQSSHHFIDLKTSRFARAMTSLSFQSTGFPTFPPESHQRSEGLTCRAPSALLYWLRALGDETTTTLLNWSKKGFEETVGVAGQQASQ